MGQGQIPHRVSRQLTSFIGRDNEIQNIVGLLQSGERLITVIGTGDIRKTRLAIEAGNRVHALFPGGVFMVELAAVTQGKAVVKFTTDSAFVVLRPKLKVVQNATKPVIGLPQLPWTAGEPGISSQR